MRYAFIALAAALLFQSCSKRNDSPDQYYGTWELRSSEGGWIGYREYPPGNGQKLVITKDSLFEYLNNVPGYKHAFAVVKDTLRGYGNERIADRLVDDAGQGIATFFERRGDKLTRYVGIPAADGGSSSYQRIK